MALTDEMWSDVALLWEDIPLSITYTSNVQKAGSAGYNTRTGAIDNMSTVFSLSGVRLEHKAALRAFGEGVVEIDDAVLLLRRSDSADTGLTVEPKEGDIFVLDGDTFQVFKWIPEEDGNTYLVAGRKVAT